MEEKLSASVQTGASLIAGAGIGESGNAKGVYHVKCFDKEGHLKFEETIFNVVCYQGKNFVLDNALAGSGFTAGWYMTLITAGTAIGTSTYASPTVTEIGSGIITSNTRIAMGWSASASGSKSATTTTFTITGTATIAGAMVVAGGTGVATVGNTSATGGVLLSAGNFTGGSKSVSNGDSLQITWSFSI